MRHTLLRPLVVGRFAKLTSVPPTPMAVEVPSADSPNRKSLFQKCFLLVASVDAVRTLLHAQNPRGSLRGTVQDATGARISSAKIVVQSIDSSLQREATTAKTVASFDWMTCCRAHTA